MTLLRWVFLVVTVLASTYLLIGIVKFLYFYFILLYLPWKKNGKKPINKYVLALEDGSADIEIIILKKLKDEFTGRYRIQEKYETPSKCIVGWGRDLLQKKLYDKLRENLSGTMAHSLLYSSRFESWFFFVAMIDYILDWPSINWHDGVYEEDAV